MGRGEVGSYESSARNKHKSVLKKMMEDLKIDEHCVAAIRAS